VPESLQRYYQKEEEFLDEFSDVGCVVASFLGDAWQPNFACNDEVRRNRDYFLSTRELQTLTFDGAAVYHDEGGFSSVQVTLRSSDRVVTVRVRKTDGDLVAEKVVDSEVKKTQ